jgi:hypothetical protein
MTDPIAAVVQYLRSLPDLPPGCVTGDMNSREVGDTTVYVEHNGGFRILRDCEDRIDIWYEVYHSDREQAASLAFLVREKFFALSDLVVGDVYFLDYNELSMPDYEPDPSSREHAYSGEVSLFYQSA